MRCSCVEGEFNLNHSLVEEEVGSCCYLEMLDWHDSNPHDPMQLVTGNCVFSECEQHH